MGIKSNKNISADFRRDMQEFERLVDYELPREIESGLNEVVSDSFEKEQWQGESGSEKWKARKRGGSGARGSRRALLVGGSDDDPKKKKKRRRKKESEETSGGDLIKSYGTEIKNGGRDITIGSDLIYAEVHNEGKRAGRGKGFQMPKRQHAPIPGEPIPELEDNIEDWMDKEMDKIFK